MKSSDDLAGSFEAQRARLTAVAYRMLGSLSEAEDAVQEAWLRLARSDAAVVENLAAWLTTVVGRVCLDMLRSRASRREEAVGARLPDPVVSHRDRIDAEHEALLSDSVSLALLVVLETLAPAERLAFVLHDMFGVPFEEIAPIVGRSPTAARQLASRARRRVRGEAPITDADPAQQREVVEAFIDAARSGNFERLVAVLEQDVVLRADTGRSRVVRGAAAVANQALLFQRFARFARPALVNGAAGLVTAPGGKPISVMAFAIRGGKIVEIDILADPARLRELDLTVLDD